MQEQPCAFFKQECIPVGCVPPAAVAVGCLHQDQTPPPQDHAPPRDQALPPPGPGTPPPDQAPPGTRHPPDQAPPCGQTDTCKHITLPQTSFAGGNNKIWRTLVFLVGQWYPCFGLLVMSATGFVTREISLLLCNGFLRFTSECNTC